MNLYTIQELHKVKKELKQQRDQLKHMREDYLKRAEDIRTVDLPEVEERISHVNDDLVKAGEPNDLS